MPGLLLALISLLLIQCSSTRQIQKRYSTDDQRVFDLLERLKKNADDAEAANFLPEAYKQAAEVLKNVSTSNYDKLNVGDRWRLPNNFRLPGKCITK